MRITEAVVQKTLDEEDIEGLREIGAPEDEYLHEAQKIVSRLSGSEPTEESLAAVVREVWVASFGPFSDEDIEKRSPVFSKVAHQILNNSR